MNAANVNMHNVGQMTPLHDAVKKGQKDICQIFVMNGAKVNVQDI